MTAEILNAIALGMIKGVGPKIGRNLYAAAGSFVGVMEMDLADLIKIDSVSEVTAKEIIRQREEVLLKAESEVEWMEKFDVEALFLTDSRYPTRLRMCDDAPMVLYVKGSADLNSRIVLSVIGTRRPTAYGREWCREVIGELSKCHPDMLVVSGLAYGIDVVAHKAALECGVKTVGVVAHGLDKVYPSQHREIAKQMVMGGGAMLTEYYRGIEPEAPNFISRNRIVAGMADATLVVESGEKGGSLITTARAIEYNRVVLAMPGSPLQEMSRGCNTLIRQQKARLVTSASDIDEVMNWVSESSHEAIQGELFPTAESLTEEQRKIYDVLLSGEKTADEIGRECNVRVSELSATLLEMEFIGIVKGLPGSRYMLIKS
ncbi:MAG: DNA-protecting protein DprA [Marinilabiliaceae bacterium]|nr:DNA-protecting protein DprA [Marinilabiliaceae bacterium]